MPPYPGSSPVAGQTHWPVRPRPIQIPRPFKNPASHPDPARSAKQLVRNTSKECETAAIGHGVLNAGGMACNKPGVANPQVTGSHLQSEPQRRLLASLKALPCDQPLACQDQDSL